MRDMRIHTSKQACKTHITVNDSLILRVNLSEEPYASLLLEITYCDTPQP